MEHFHFQGVDMVAFPSVRFVGGQDYEKLAIFGTVREPCPCQACWVDLPVKKGQNNAMNHNHDWEWFTPPIYIPIYLW